MNINKATFNGIRIKVTYKCGHVATELSASDMETRERVRFAAAFDCTNCSVDKRLKQTALRPIVDPVSLQHAARRKEQTNLLLNKFESMRTKT